MPSAKKRGGLGRGLNALVSEAEYETGGSSASASNAASETKLPIEDIVPNPNQPRIHFNETELRELSESIQEHGVLQPLLVRKHGNGYEIIAGERRYQASKLAGLEELPVIIKDVNDEEMLALALIENLQRSDLNPVEEAKGYRQLIDASGMTQEALSKAVSKSRSAITNSLRLLDLPEVVQQMIFEGKLTAGHARVILAVPYEDARIRLAEKVVAEGLSVSINDILRATKQTTSKFIVCRYLIASKGTSRYSRHQCNRSKNLIPHLGLLDQTESFHQEYERALPRL